MDASQVRALRELLATTGWPERTQDFARSLRASTRVPGGLLLFGPRDGEPWHLAAHLDDESRLRAGCRRSVRRSCAGSRRPAHRPT